MLEERLPLLGLEHFHDLSNPGAKLKELLRPVWRAKDELVGPGEYRRMARENLDRAEAEYAALRRQTKVAFKPVEVAQKTMEAAAVYDEYEKLLRSNGLVDFADLVMLPTLLMRREPKVLRELRDQHREILVDEFQDVNRASAEMVKLLWGDENRVWVVGDARQSIYRFRGASPLNMERFERDFPAVEGEVDRIPLAFNYRSTDHITRLCRTFAAATDAIRDQEGFTPAGLPYAAEAEREDEGTATKLLVGQDDDCEADLLEREIRRLRDGGIPYGRQTVLARTNTRLDTLAARLLPARYPCSAPRQFLRAVRGPRCPVDPRHRRRDERRRALAGGGVPGHRRRGSRRRHRGRACPGSQPIPRRGPSRCPIVRGAEPDRGRGARPLGRQAPGSDPEDPRLRSGLHLAPRSR